MEYKVTSKVQVAATTLTEASRQQWSLSDTCPFLGGCTYKVVASSEGPLPFMNAVNRRQPASLRRVTQKITHRERDRNALSE